MVYSDSAVNSWIDENSQSDSRLCCRKSNIGVCNTRAVVVALQHISLMLSSEGPDWLLLEISSIILQKAWKKKHCSNITIITATFCYHVVIRTYFHQDGRRCHQMLIKQNFNVRGKKNLTHVKIFFVLDDGIAQRAAAPFGENTKPKQTTITLHMAKKKTCKFVFAPMSLPISIWLCLIL